MDTYSHVIPGLDEQAAETVARLILGDGEAIADLSANKPLESRTGIRIRRLAWLVRVGGR
jgi:hypothetical protein